jgi:hypothetical protein
VAAAAASPPLRAARAEAREAAAAAEPHGGTFGAFASAVLALVAAPLLTLAAASVLPLFLDRFDLGGRWDEAAALSPTVAGEHAPSRRPPVGTGLCPTLPVVRCSPRVLLAAAGAFVVAPKATELLQQRALLVCGAQG